VVWGVGLFNQQIALGFVSLGAFRWARVYGNYFMSKLRKLGGMKIALATFALLTVPRLALACPVCFGGPIRRKLRRRRWAFSRCSW
jgi:hypothetical protein